MGEMLSCRCINAKVNKEEDVKKWLGDVKQIDDTMRAEHCEFEQVAKVVRDSTRKVNPLGEPLYCANASSNNRGGQRPNTNVTGGGMVLKLPKLTNNECRLLFDNNGCLKCRKFFVNHCSANCPNGWLIAASYHTLMQGDVNCAHNGGKAKTVATINTGDNNVAGPSAHPITVVLGTSSAPVAHMPSNASNVIEGTEGSASENSMSVMHNRTPVPPTVSEGHESPPNASHLHWRCLVEGRDLTAPYCSHHG
jgi:hypothetical protein